MMEWDDLVLEKLGRVLGPGAAVPLFDRTCRQLRLSGLHSADDVYNFRRELQKAGGIVGACGASLSLTALMRGARPEKPAPAATPAGES